MRFRLTLSANKASMAAEKATPSVDALIVKLTLASDAWNTLGKQREEWLGAVQVNERKHAAQKRGEYLAVRSKAQF